VLLRAKKFNLLPLTFNPTTIQNTVWEKLADLINQYTGDTGISAKAVVTSTTAAITAGTTGSDFAINGVNIGSINVAANDADGTLLTAINNKSTETGVTASKTTDGKITLTSTDGRAISVTGDLSGVTTRHQ